MSASSQLRDALVVEPYAPNFKVAVDDEPLAPSDMGDILDLHVTIDTKDAGSFSLTVNDWDDDQLWFKYSHGDLFAPNRIVTIELGYADRLWPVWYGPISSMCPRYPEAGSPSLVVSGQDALRLMAQRQRQEGEKRVFAPGTTDWEIAREVAKRNNLVAEVTERGPRRPQVNQSNRDDATFLRDLAKRNEFDVYIRIDPASRRPVLHFEAPNDGRDGRPVRVYGLEWGRDLLSFTPRLSTAKQVAKIVVRGWDPKTNSSIVASADHRDLAVAGGASGPSQAPRGSVEVVVDQVVRNQDEARSLAVGLLRDRARRFTTGTAKIIGSPAILPGDNVDIRNLPSRFGGTYYVVKVDHTLGSGGFTTELELERPRPRAITRGRSR